MRTIRSKLTYANVVATIALFLALSGGVVWAAKKIGTGRLKASSVTAGKIKKNAVTATKIRNNAVINSKLKRNAVTFDKIAAGTDVVAVAQGGPVSVDSEGLQSVALSGTTTFTPQAGVVDFLGVEASGHLGHKEEQCNVTIIPYVNGNPFPIAEGLLRLATNATSEFSPNGVVPATSGSGPLGITSPGVTQTISVKVGGDTECTADSSVSVGIVVTQSK